LQSLPQLEVMFESAAAGLPLSKSRMLRPALAVSFSATWSRTSVAKTLT